MSVPAIICIVAVTLLAMEGLAWGTHKYVMHGFAWGLHRSHHEKRVHAFEKNDWFAVFFGVPAFLLILFDRTGQGAAYWVGIGASLYGLLYFIVHDGLVHRRWPVGLHRRGAYLRRLVQAHRLHHAIRAREGCVSFGFLYAPPPRRLRNALRAAHPRHPAPSS